MKKYFFYWLALCVVIVVGCQKELSFEGPNSPAEGSLQADITGDCLPKTVNGVYEVGKPLVADSNTISVEVNVAITGTYVITTDTINGYFFRATGIFTTPGINTIKLRGNGTPFANGTNNFVVTFDSTVCDVQVIVAQPGVGSLGGTPNACAPITVNGAYSPGIALTAANTASVQVNVTTPGNFIITTDTVAGIWFSYSGNLASSQTVILKANGNIPAATATGSKVFTVKLGASICTFTVNVAGPAVGTVDCSSAVIFGNYPAGQPIFAGNNVQLLANVVTTGAYSITTDTVNGVWFSRIGNFPSTGITPLILTAMGTPTNQGPFSYVVKWGTSTCTFSLTFNPPLSNDYYPRISGSNWSYEFNDVATDSLLRYAIPTPLTIPAGTFTRFLAEDGDIPEPDSSGYYRKTGGDYFRWVDAGTPLGYDNTSWTEYIFLKDNVAIGSPAWKTPLNGYPGTVNGGTPINVRYSYKILQKDIPITLTTSVNPGGITYQNVIVVEEKLEVEQTPGAWQDATSSIDYYGKSYYARGIGLIQFTQFNASNVEQFKMKLRRFQLF